MITFIPGFNGFKSLACVDHLSAPFKNLCLNATSLDSRQSTHTSAGENCPGLIGRKSLIGLPNINWLGDKPYSASGVLRCCIIALIILSHCGEPSALVLSNNSRLPLLTAVSARRLLCGWYEELTLCWLTPQLVRNCLNWLDLNCGPSSVATCSAIPYVQK